MAQSFNFGFSGDDIDEEANDENVFKLQNGAMDVASSSPQLIEPRLHTMQDLVSRMYLVGNYAVL